MTAVKGQDARAWGQPLRWGRARRWGKGTAQRAVVCTSMERAALPNMAPIVQETVLPRRTLLGIRPSEVDRHQTEPVPTHFGPLKRGVMPTGVFRISSLRRASCTTHDAQTQTPLAVIPSNLISEFRNSPFAGGPRPSPLTSSGCLPREQTQCGNRREYT